jgi:hypothetical protein
MKFNIKTKIDVKEFIPAKLIPRSGNIKKLKITENRDNIMLSSFRCRSLILPKKICLNFNDFIAIGLYLAEGTTYCNLNKKTKHSGEIAFVNSNPDSIIIICKLLNKFKISTNNLKWKIGLNIHYKDKIKEEELFDYWVQKIGLDKNKARPKWFYHSGRLGGRLRSNTGKKGCLHIFYASTIFRNFFLNFMQKVFNKSIENKSKEKLALILKGFFAGDGSVNYSDKYDRKLVEFLTNDIELSNKIRKSLEILGLTSIKETWPESTKTHTKSLRIYNKHDFMVLAHYGIPNFVDYKRETFSKIINSL